MRLVFFCIVQVISVVILQAQEFKSSRSDFDQMANYLSKGSGKWMAPNPRYNDMNPKSTKALGLWFDKRLDDKLLHLSVVLYREDTAHIISDAMWFWHPVEQRITYIDMTSGGQLQLGETYFNTDEEFVNRNFQYQTNGKVVFARGVNLILSEDRHKTTSYVFENDDWRVQGSLEWSLTKEGEGYQAIKRN